MSTISLVGGTILTCDEQRTIIPRGTVVIEDGYVSDVVDRAVTGGIKVDCTGRLVIPGLVNVHAHLLESLFRGAGGELSLVPWIVSRSHPLMAAHDGPSVGASVRLAALEMLRSGTTAFLDPEVPPAWRDEAADAVAATGLRGTLAVALDSGHGYATGHGQASSSIHAHDGQGDPHAAGAPEAWTPEAVRALLEPTPSSASVRRWLGPRVLSAVSPEMGESVRQVVERENAGITFHCAEAEADVESVRSRFGMGPADYARSVGLLGSHTVITHAIHLDDEDLVVLAETGTSVAHCPSSNAKLGSGIARIVRMLDLGIPVGLGSDGGMANDTYDLFVEMRLAALLQKVALRDPAAITPETVLDMATVNGGRALQLPVGRLTPGSLGDAVVLDLRCDGSWPTVDPIDTLVFGGGRAAVRDVIVGGIQLVREGSATELDQDAIYREAADAAAALVDRSGLADAIRPRWARHLGEVPAHA